MNKFLLNFSGVWRKVITNDKDPSCSRLASIKRKKKFVDNLTYFINICQHAECILKDFLLFMFIV